MLDSSILYLPIGRKTFDMEAAEQYRNRSSAFLASLSEKVLEPAHILTSPEELEQFINEVKFSEIDLIIYQSTTFADAEFIASVVSHFSQPVVVWSVREPSVGGRLRLNSLTGGNSTCHYLRDKSHPYSFILGNPDEAALQRKLAAQVNVNQLIGKLRNLKIGVVGEHPPGFFFSDTNEALLKEKLGVSTIQMDLRMAFDEAKEMPEEQYSEMIARAESQVIGLNRSDETVKRFAQFSTYLKGYITENQIQATAIRCWPEFFNELGAAACSTLSQFTEDGVVSSCEADIHGSISMYIMRELSGGEAPYLGDLVHVNEENNSFVFWHCGAGAYSLASKRTGAQAGVHPNRKIGFTLEFGLKPGQVTIFRLNYSAGEFRLFVLKGEALDVPQVFNGTSVEVQLEKDAAETLNKLMEEGIEPHYAIVYDDIVDELVEFGRRMGIQTLVLG